MYFGKYNQPGERRRKHRIDWEKIKNEYIYADPIIDEKLTTIRYPNMMYFIEKYDVSKTALCLRAAKEGWYQQRLAYQRKIRDLHDRELDIMSLRKSALFDAENLARLKMFSQIFDAWLAENKPDNSDVNSDDVALRQLCADENIDLHDETHENASEDTSANTDDETYPVTYQRAPQSEYDENGDIVGKSLPSIKDLNQAMDVMQKMHKLNRDIMGEPINYEKFYAEKAAESRRVAEKGKAVTRDDIRDLISNMKKKGETAVTLDVTPDEEEGLKNVTND